jgi:hypothetical protein
MSDLPRPLTDYEKTVNDFIALLQALRAWRKVINLYYQGRLIGRATVNFAGLMQKSSRPEITIVDHFDDDPNIVAWRKLNGGISATLGAASADQPTETTAPAAAENPNPPPNLPPISPSRPARAEIPRLADADLAQDIAATPPILQPLGRAFGDIPNFDEMLRQSFASGILAIPSSDENRSRGKAKNSDAAKTPPPARTGSASGPGPQPLDQHLPTHIQRNDGTGVDVTFGNSENGVNSDQLVTQKLESTFSDLLKDDSKISSVNVSATTNGHCVGDHVNGDAVDINVINGVHVAASGPGFKNAEDLENAAKKDDNVRYIEGPAGNFVRREGDPNFVPSRGGLPGNDNHVHIAVFADK